MTVRPAFTLWLTGLSGAGKTTLARSVGDELVRRGRVVEILDGDEIRSHLGRRLGFSKHDRDTHVAWLGYAASLLSRNGVIAIVAAISPYREVRAEVRRFHDGPFVEVFVDCTLDELLKRDPKGLYAKATRGEIPNFTGVSDPYEPPDRPDVHVHTDVEAVAESNARILDGLRRRGLIEDDRRG